MNIQEIDPQKFHELFYNYQELVLNKELKKFHDSICTLMLAILKIFGPIDDSNFDKVISYMTRMNYLLKFVRDYEERLKFLDLVRVEIDHDLLISLKLFEIFATIEIPCRRQLRWTHFLRVYRGEK